MTARSPGELLAAMIDLLSTAEPEVRNRTLAAAQVYFTASATGQPVSHAPLFNHMPIQSTTDGPANTFPERAKLWMRQGGLAMEEVEKVFHIGDGRVEIIAATMPGKSKKEQTFNAYILLGLSRLMAGGAPSFDDKEGRQLCITHGCYDAANHATNFKDKGNDFAGSKDTGWTLTAPGLKSGAIIVKELAQAG